MEALTRLVTESLVRHGFDRPLDYRRLHWSHWFRCESVHSLLFVPSKPGVFALAEEISDFGPRDAHVETAASAVPRSNASGPEQNPVSTGDFKTPDARRPSPDTQPRRMLAVTQFFEDDDMAFVLDRMLSRENPLRTRLLSGRYFIRFVAIDDPTQRRSICAALNQWMANSAEKATGIGGHFATSLELTPATEYETGEGHDFSRADRTAQNAPALAAEGFAGAATLPSRAEKSSLTSAAPHLDSGAASNIHCPSPLPSGF